MLLLVLQSIIVSKSIDSRLNCKEKDTYPRFISYRILFRWPLIRRHLVGSNIGLLPVWTLSVR